MSLSLNVVKGYLLCSFYNVESEIEDPRRPMPTLQRCSGMESQVQQIQITNAASQMVSTFYYYSILVYYNESVLGKMTGIPA